MDIQATYSLQDNKLRLYPSARLDKETYDRVKAAGFVWAPRQELFVAPAWTPQREDLALELAGEIGDEDISREERAEVRAERFAGYQERRAADAQRTYAAVTELANGIPLGQPILVGHHSERRARKDAERIEGGLRKAVNLWKTAEYWQWRATGCLSDARYKELPAVRARRIKGLEADIRRCQAEYTPYDDPPQIILQQEYSYTRGEYLHNGEPVPHVWCAPKGGRGGSWVPVHRLEAIKERNRRWIEHYENRLAYERAMLGEQGGLITDQHDLQPGGMVLVGDTWLTITKVNKKEGQAVSVSTNARYVRVKGVEEIKDYRPPSPEQTARVKEATRLPPLCNYPGDGYVPITQAQWDRIHQDYKTTREQASDTQGRHRVRHAMAGQLHCEGVSVTGPGYGLHPVYITDAKRKDAPPPDVALAPVPVLPVEKVLPVKPTPVKQPDEPSRFEKLAETLKAGVQVVSAPELFPTPAPVVARLMALAEVQPGQTVLEPSAGTGAIADVLKATGADVVCCELNDRLADVLAAKGHQVVAGDFLERFSRFDPVDGVGEVSPAMVQFDRVVMNPPFSAEVSHVRHAWKLLKAGGKLASIMSEGPFFRERDAGFREWLEEIGAESEKLPADSFKDSGTKVQTRIVWATK